ncbi:unnamed protein product [Musa acuminata subsp. burmannicoides]
MFMTRGLNLVFTRTQGIKHAAMRLNLVMARKIFETFASWVIDYLKYDNCNNDDLKPMKRYHEMTRAHDETGGPILSLCEWGDMHPALWADKLGNSWRTTFDINDSWYGHSSFVWTKKFSIIPFRGLTEIPRIVPQSVLRTIIYYIYIFLHSNPIHPCRLLLLSVVMYGA